MQGENDSRFLVHKLRLDNSNDYPKYSRACNAGINYLVSIG